MFKMKKLGTLWSFLIAFGATLLVLGAALFLVYNYVFSGMEKDSSTKTEDFGVQQQDYHTKEIENIALFGVDTTDDSMVGRSDSIIVLTIDSKKKEIRMSAIQRDTYVTVEGHGKTKINHAFAYGGPTLAVKTLNQNFGLDITDYVVINFTNMEKVVDALGGIELDVSETYRKEANKQITYLAEERKIKVEPIKEDGMQTLSGMQVLGMLRARYNVGGVAVRSQMHEVVLQACYQKVKSMNALQYPKVAKTMLGLVKTTLSSGDVTSIGMKVMVENYQFRQAVFPLVEDQPNGDGGKIIDGVWYLTYNEENGNQHIRDFIYDGVLYGEKAETDTTE